MGHLWSSWCAIKSVMQFDIDEFKRPGENAQIIVTSSYTPTAR